MSVQRHIQLCIQSFAANITECLLERKTVQYYKMLLTFLDNVLHPSSGLNLYSYYILALKCSQLVPMKNCWPLSNYSALHKIHNIFTHSRKKVKSHLSGMFIRKNKSFTKLRYILLILLFGITEYYITGYMKYIILWDI
jgi:hypothetical protein